MNKQVMLVDRNKIDILIQVVENKFPNMDTIYSNCVESVYDNNLVKIVIISGDHFKEEAIKDIRSKRKDIFVCVYLSSPGLTEEKLYLHGIDYIKKNSVNLAMVVSTNSDLGLVVAPEESYYHVGNSLSYVFNNLIDMAFHRSHLTFTQSDVISSPLVPWDSPEVPQSLRRVVDHCISRGAYKSLRGVTAGHFAVKLNDNTFLSSIRKTNFNDLDKNGLVKIVTNGPDTVLAYGAKPSVGGQSQRIVFRDHQGYDCIVHFHCPIKEGSLVPKVSQREFECGSHECGQNTSNGLKQFGNLKAVYLDNHGPNILFNRNIDPYEVINFIESNFDLSEKTGGFVSILKDALPSNTLENAQVLLT